MTTINSTFNTVNTSGRIAPLSPAARASEPRGVGAYCPHEGRVFLAGEHPAPGEFAVGVTARLTGRAAREAFEGAPTPSFDAETATRLRDVLEVEGYALYAYPFRAEDSALLEERDAVLARAYALREAGFPGLDAVEREALDTVIAGLIRDLISLAV